MPVNIENIKKALDSFESDDFVTAKELLQQEISQAKDAYLKDKLSLEKDIEEACSSKKKTKKVVVEEEEE